MRRAEWYVIQVETGRERSVCDAIVRACERAGRNGAVKSGVERSRTALLRECFAPRYRSRYKLRGQWHDEERLLLPGYLVAVTADPWELARVLRGVPGLTRILTMGETFAPLSDDDRSWLERWTKEGERTIPLSVAHKVGDRVVVTEGPLKGHEGMIGKVKRRLNEAEIVIHAGQVTIRTTVGLAVLPGPSEGE